MSIRRLIQSRTQNFSLSLTHYINILPYQEFRLINEKHYGEQTKCSIQYVALFFCLAVFSFAKKEDIKDFWLAQGLNEAIPLLEVLC